MPVVTEITEIDSDSIVRVVFKGHRREWVNEKTGKPVVDDAETFDCLFNSKHHRLVKNQDSFIPFAAACLYFGDPRSTESLRRVENEQGQSTYIPDRATERRRLQSRYDNRGGDDNRIINAPSVEIYTLEGERLHTVIDDPSGETAIEAKSTIADSDNLRMMVLKQQKLIEQLIEKSQPQEPSVNTDEVVSIDPTLPPDESVELPQQVQKSVIIGLPQDIPEVNTEAATGERGGKLPGDQPVDWTSLVSE